MDKKKRYHSKMPLGQEYYAGYDSRRMQEMKDASMISEDHSATANLPQNVIMRQYSKNMGYTPEILDDTIRGVDEQIMADNRGKMKMFKPHKY